MLFESRPELTDGVVRPKDHLLDFETSRVGVAAYAVAEYAQTRLGGKLEWVPGGTQVGADTELLARQRCEIEVKPMLVIRGIERDGDGIGTCLRGIECPV